MLPSLGLRSLVVFLLEGFDGTKVITVEDVCMTFIS